VKPDGLIEWPADPQEACAHYLEFAIATVDALGIEFSGARVDPRLVARQYVERTMSEDEYRSERAWWWDRVDAAGGIRDLSDRETQHARLALCLLGATPDQASQLGDKLSWFLEVLGFLGFKAKVTDPMVESYFTYRDS
jgi:hypothetical protein